MFYRTAKFVKRGQRFECLEVSVFDQNPVVGDFEPTPTPILYMRVQNPHLPGMQVYFRTFSPVATITLVNNELFRLSQFLMENNWRGRCRDYDLITSNVF